MGPLLLMHLACIYHSLLPLIHTITRNPSLHLLVVPDGEAQLPQLSSLPETRMHEVGDASRCRACVLFVLPFISTMHEMKLRVP